MESDLAIVTELDSNEEVKIQVALQQLSHRVGDGRADDCTLVRRAAGDLQLPKRIEARVHELRSAMDESVPPALVIESANTVPGAAACRCSGASGAIPISST